MEIIHALFSLFVNVYNVNACFIIAFKEQMKMKLDRKNVQKNNFNV